MHHLNKKIAIIFFLGISSGLPMALILSTLKALLSDKGFDIQTMGFLSLATLPYSLKFFFAPIIDSCAIPYFTKRLGQRKSWIIFTQIILIFNIALLGIAGEAANLLLITFFSFLVALASSLQDIVIDGYRIELIEQKNQGIAASFYTYGYRIGLLISGAFALFLADKISWQIVYFIMSFFMASCLITTLIAQETRKEWHQKKFHFASWINNFIIAPLLDFSKKPRWYFIFFFIIFFKLGDVFAGSLTTPFLLAIDFTKTEIASIVKTFGLFATLVGVFVGGILIKKLGTKKSLWIAAIAQMLSNLAFSYLAQIGHNDKILCLVIFIENFSGGIGDSVFVAYLSILCNISFSATQYATLTSLASLARSLFSSSAGLFAANLGWCNFFIFSTILAIPGLIFLFLLQKK